MSKLGDYYICAKRGGLPFDKMPRPLADGNCPSGYYLCNPTASNDNKICA